MNKYYNSLLMAAVVGLAANGLVASEKQENIIANKSTLGSVAKTLKNYALCYTGLFSVGAFDGAIIGREIQKKYLKNGNAIQKLIVTSFSEGNPILAATRMRCVQVAGTMPFTFPMVVIPVVAYSSYKNFDNSPKIDDKK